MRDTRGREGGAHDMCGWVDADRGHVAGSVIKRRGAKGVGGVGGEGGWKYSSSRWQCYTEDHPVIG